MESDATILTGMEVALVGRFATISQSQFGDLISQFGGRLARSPSEQTQYLVVGQGSLPLGQDGSPVAALERARRLIDAGSDLQILSEEAFLKRVGLDGGSQAIHRRYTIVQLARILKLPGQRVRSWIRQGLIKPAETANGIALFGFHQVAAARTLCQLIESGLAPAEIRKGLRQLQKLLPDSRSPLLQVSAAESTSQLLVRLDDGRIAEASGQLRLEFEPDQFDDDDHPKFIAVARSFGELLADAVSLEEAGRYDDAAETYRIALDRDAEHPVLHFNLGNVMHRLGHTDHAAQQFELAVRCDPVFVEGWNNLGCMLLETGQRNEAIQAFQRALKLAPSYADARSNLETAMRG